MSFCKGASDVENNCYTVFIVVTDCALVGVYGEGLDDACGLGACFWGVVVGKGLIQKGCDRVLRGFRDDHLALDSWTHASGFS